MPSTILSDNGVSSGSAGIKTTGSNDGALALQTTTAGGTATTAVTIDTSQQTGFGTASPTARVTLSGTGAAVAQDFTNTTSSTGRRWRVVSGDNGNAYITDMTGSADILSIGSSGNTIALQGGSISSGAGIAFPATQVASSNANTLDDYEEGTWTPVWAAISGSMTYAASGQIGTYTKIGRQVTAYCHVITTANNSLSGALQLNNLPFPSSSAANYCVGTMHMEGCNIQAAVWAWGYVAPGTQTAYFRYWANNAGAATVVGSQLNANSDIMFAVTYFV